jgi:hypothetical protein
MLLKPFKSIEYIPKKLVEPGRIELLTSSLPEWRSDCSVSEGKGREMKRIVRY